MNLEETLAEITSLLESQHEWLLIHSSGKSFALERGEIEIEIKHRKILFSFLDENGFQTWRVSGFEEKRREILLNLTRNFEKEREKVRLVPRVLAKELSESVELARLEKANQTAGLIVSENKNAKLVRVALNKENGRFAQILFEDGKGKRIAALADVSGQLTPEIHLTTAILWLSRISNRKKKPINEIWILAEKKLCGKLIKLHSLLKENWKRHLRIFEISDKDEKARNEMLIPKESMKISDLWRERARKASLPANSESSRAAREIIKFAPEKIDVMLTKNGETLRFLGLPFARVRSVAGEEKCWFGIEREKRILSENSREDFFELLENLETYRRFETPNKRHALYNSAPEAWLEAILRKNIKLLDRNLILSPLYHQFRADRDKIDLLALRRDGRLIIIEIKVEPDREMIFQAADYWRKVELSRLKGNLNQTKLFGEIKISDAPPVIYLVAPTLSFHRDFDFFAKTVAPEIEIFRFDLAENWREKLQITNVREIRKI